MAEAIPPDLDEEEEIPPDLQDFGFNHPFSYVEMVAEFLRLSNYNVWPEPGGLNNQDYDLVWDILNYFKLYNRIEWEVRNDQFIKGSQEVQHPSIEDILTDG